MPPTYTAKYSSQGTQYKEKYDTVARFGIGRFGMSRFGSSTGAAYKPNYTAKFSSQPKDYVAKYT